MPALPASRPTEPNAGFLKYAPLGINLAVIALETDLAAVAALVHGTTVATTAVLERKERAAG